jgi:hypothetical protein
MLEYFTFHLQKMAEIRAKVSESDTLFDFYERMFIIARAALRTDNMRPVFPFGLSFSFREEGKGRVHAGDYTAPGAGFTVPLADKTKLFWG